MSQQLSQYHKSLVSELILDIDDEPSCLKMIEDAVRWRLFRDFESATNEERLTVIGPKLDAVSAVMAEFQRIANEVAVSGRTDSA